MLPGVGIPQFSTLCSVLARWPETHESSSGALTTKHGNDAVAIMSSAKSLRWMGSSVCKTMMRSWQRPGQEDCSLTTRLRVLVLVKREYNGEANVKECGKYMETLGPFKGLFRGVFRL